MKNLPILTILLLSIITAQPGSDVPVNMSFQGLLADSDGVIYSDGEYELTFRLIRQLDDTAEQTIWEETHTANIFNGVFSVILGSITPLPLNIPPNILLETQVGDEILSPRQSLTSVPFALNSSRSQQAFQSVLSDSANFAHNAQNATHADSANFVINLPMVDSVQFAHYSQHSTHSDSAMFTMNSQHAVHADTAILTMHSNHSNFADSSGFSFSSNHSTYADTAQYVALVQNANNATHADTANYVINDQGATSIDGLSDALVEDNSIYIGHDPSSTTNNALKNIAIGRTALNAITTGDENVAIGYNVLTENTTGSNNMAIGTGALLDNISGTGNSAIGYRSLYENTNGNYNSAIGSYSARENTTGDKNVAVGNSSLRDNTTGNNNTAVGQGSGFSIIGGNDNTTVGQRAGNVITTGSNNVIIGSESDPSANNATNQIVIGKSAVGHGDNIAVIGNTDMTAIHPAEDNGVDLGSSSYSYKDAHIDGTAYINTLQTSSIVPTGIGEKYIEITIEGNYGSGQETFDLDNALGSTNTWYKLEPLVITEWDGVQSYFNIQMDVLSSAGNRGDIDIDMQSSQSRPRISNDHAFYIYSSDGQHELYVTCVGRDSTVKILFRVTSDWSS